MSITTITTVTTTSTITSSSMVGSLGILAIVLFIALLTVKELCRDSQSAPHKVLARSLDVGIVPLGMVFALTVLLRTLGAIQ
jgi:hypothetical protein